MRIEKQKNAQLIFGTLLFAVLTLALVGWGFWSACTAVRLSAGGVLTQGVITGSYRGTKHNGSRVYVEYFNAAGQKVEFTSKHLMINWAGYKTGDIVPVLYDSQDSSLVDINSFIPLWSDAILAFALGGFFTWFLYKAYV